MEQRWTPRLNTTQSGQAPQGRECPPTLTYSCYSHFPLLTTDHPTVHTLRSHPFSLPTASAVFPETVRHTLGKGDRIVVKGLPLPIVVPEGVVLAVIVAPAAQVAPPSTTTGYSTPAAMEVVRLEAALEAALEATELARLQELKGQLAAAKGVLAQQEAAMEAAWAGQQQQQQQDHPQQQYGRDGFASNPLPDDGNAEGDEEPSGEERAEAMAKLQQLAALQSQLVMLRQMSNEGGVGDGADARLDEMHAQLAAVQGLMGNIVSDDDAVDGEDGGPPPYDDEYDEDGEYEGEYEGETFEGDEEYEGGYDAGGAAGTVASGGEASSEGGFDLELRLRQFRDLQAEMDPTEAAAFGTKLAELQALQGQLAAAKGLLAQQEAQETQETQTGQAGGDDGTDQDDVLARLGALQQEQEAGHAADMEERMAELLLRQVQGGDGGHRDGGNSGGVGGGDGRHMPSAEAAEAVEMEDKLAQ